MHKLLAVLIVLFVLEEFAEFLYRRTDAYKRTLSGFAHLHAEIPDDLEIVNVGSGPGLYGIGYEYCTRKGFNFSTAPQNFKNGFKILRRFSQKVRLHAIIIIIIIMCPMSFGRNSDYNSPGYYDKFYGVLPPDEIENYSIMRAFKLKHPLLLRVLRKLKGMFSSQKAAITPKAPEHDSDLPPIVRTWTSEFGLHDLKDPSQAQAHEETFREKIEILADEVNYCHAHQWHPVFVVPPIPESTRAHISEAFIKAFTLDNMAKLTERYPDVHVLNYYADPRITDDMFNGGVFLNAKGREAFSRILFSDIEKERAKHEH